MSGKARAFYPITLLGLALLLGGCVSGGFQGERDSAMGWWAMTTPGVLGGILGERDAAMATSRYEELEKIGERETEGLKDIPSPKLMPLCMAYAKLKRYSKLFPCLDRPRTISAKATSAPWISTSLPSATR